MQPDVEKRLWNAVKACKRIQSFTCELDYVNSLVHLMEKNVT
jgi:hypothetical protein